MNDYKCMFVAPFGYNDLSDLYEILNVDDLYPTNIYINNRTKEL